MRLIDLDAIMAQFPKADFYGDAIENMKAYPHWRTDITGLINILKAVPIIEQHEDCISRQAVLDKFAEVSNISKRPYHDMWEYVEKMPPVTPKAEPCEDAIRRADVLKYAQLVRDDEGIVHEMVHVDDIKGSSSVTWSGWKSVTWELPEPNTAVLLYVKYKSSGQWTYQLGMWDDNKLAWEDWRTPYDLEEEFEVIAWMELPERYEEDNNEW